MGGTGKTTFILYLLQRLEHKTQMAVVSRGYRAKKKDAVTIVSCGKGVLVDVDTAGDEPFLIACKHPSTIVITAAHREAGIDQAIALGACMILLDDGLQQHTIEKSLSIAMVKQEGSQHFFPWGLLRDTPKRLHQADWIVYQPPMHHNWKIPSIAMSYKPLYLLVNQTKIKHVQGLVVAVCSAIADPYSLVQMLEQWGLIVKQQWFFPDHTLPSEQEWNHLCEQSEVVDYIVCTEKDAVKLPAQYRLKTDKLAIVVCEFQAQESQQEAVLMDCIEALIR